MKCTSQMRKDDVNGNYSNSDTKFPETLDDAHGNDVTQVPKNTTKPEVASQQNDLETKRPKAAMENIIEVYRRPRQPISKAMQHTMCLPTQEAMDYYSCAYASHL